MKGRQDTEDTRVIRAKKLDDETLKLLPILNSSLTFTSAARNTAQSEVKVKDEFEGNIVEFGVF